MKQKVLDLIYRINLSLIVFLAYSTKIIVFSANFADSAILAVLAMTYGCSRYFNLKDPIHRKDKLKDEVTKLSADLKEIKGVMTKVNISQINQNKRMF